MITPPGDFDVIKPSPNSRIGNLYVDVQDSGWDSAVIFLDGGDNYKAVEYATNLTIDMVEGLGPSTETGGVYQGSLIRMQMDADGESVTGVDLGLLRAHGFHEVIRDERSSTGTTHSNGNVMKMETSQTLHLYNSIISEG